MKCGDANPTGNVALYYKGGCTQELTLEDTYRCTGCDGRFHKVCILAHFKLEKEHDWGRSEERKDIFRQLFNYWRTLKEQGMTEKQFIIRFDKFLTSLRYEGNFIEKNCPKCGARLLGNSVDDEWCSFVECDYGLKEERGNYDSSN